MADTNTVERSAVFTAGRKDADSGLAPARPTDTEYMEGYESSDRVLITFQPQDTKTDVTVTLKPSSVKSIFAGLAGLMGMGLDVERQAKAMQAWNTLADAVFEQVYATTADQVVLEGGDPEVTADAAREQLGLEACGLPSWFFQIRNALEEAQTEAALATIGGPLQ